MSKLGRRVLHAGLVVEAAGLLACSFGVAFWLSRRAREMGGPTGAQPEGQ